MSLFIFCMLKERKNEEIYGIAAGAGNGWDWPPAEATTKEQKAQEKKKFSK